MPFAASGQGKPPKRFPHQRYLIRSLKEFDRLFDHIHIDAGIDAGPVRPVVDDAVDGNGMDILDAEGKVALARDGNDAAWPECRDPATSQCPAVNHFEMQPVFIAEFQEPADRAFPASQAVIDIRGKLPVADIDLEAVRKEHDYPVAPDAPPLRPGQGVVNLYKRGAEPVPFDADELRQGRRNRKEHGNGNGSDRAGTEKIDTGERRGGNETQTDKRHEKKRDHGGAHCQEQQVVEAGESGFDEVENRPFEKQKDEEARPA